MDTNLPSNWEPNALLSSLCEVELAPESLSTFALSVQFRWSVPDLDGGGGCSHDGWRAGACHACGS